MSILRRLTGPAAVLAAVLAAVAAVSLSPAPASAETSNGCGWPRVCFYLTMNDWWAGTPTSAFRDVTSSYQDLGSRSRGSDWVRNSRNDDRAWLRYLSLIHI